MINNQYEDMVIYKTEVFAYPMDARSPMPIQDKTIITDEKVDETEQPIPTVTQILNSSSEIMTVSTPTPLPIHEFSERLVVCQEQKIQDEESFFPFFWLDISCLNKETSCDQMLEPYFQFQLEKEEWLMDFSLKDNSFLYTIFRDSSRQERDLYLYDISQMKTIPISYNGGVIYARYSPDFNQYLFTTLQSYLYITDAHGNGQSYNNDLIISHSASFSPDNQKIAFVAEARERPMECNINPDFSTELNLYYIDLSKPSEAIQLTFTGIDDGRCGMVSYNKPLVWSQDSANIIYAKEVDVDQQLICMVNVNSLEEVCYDEFEFTRIYNYDLSRKGQLVIDALIDDFDYKKCVHVCGIEEINSDIFVLELNSKKLNQITDNTSSDVFPIWIENDQYIAYESYQNGAWQIFIADPNGEWIQQVTSSKESLYLNGMCR
jgi:hypothetical protein